MTSLPAPAPLTLSTVPDFQPGFRLSGWDTGVLLVSFLTAYLLFPALPAVSFGVVFVVGHFFLFCNVVRMARRYELSWAAVFVLSVASSANLNWPFPLGLQTLFVPSFCTLVVLGLQLHHPSYHGVGWRFINPSLPTWWQAHKAPSSH